MKYSAKHIGEHICRYVDEHDTTKSALASNLGISRSALYEKIDGKRHWLIDETIRLAEIMGCEVVDLLVPPIS